ncbi:MAG: CAP domain-containing protein [Lutibacter sp.]|uniref:CAP domain-containing protein n=1 Tax=Lutibacter sp. TaxID=1925666 RepID=UPI0038587D32
MKISNIKLVVILALSFSVLTSCSKEDDGIYFSEIKDVKVEYSVMELEILDLVNNHRLSLGLQSLESLSYISSVAYSHTEYMVETDQVNHDGFPQRQENLVLKANAKSVGENVAYGFNSAKGVVNAWLNSSEHRAIIENESYTHFGISIEKNSEGRFYFTQMFIKK